MKKIMLAAVMAAMAVGGSVASESSPLWLRNSAISPDGSTIAFTYKGDIYTVGVNGGNATRITTEGYNTAPVWSPDSRTLAFSSDRRGSDDIFIVDAAGGTPRRLTTNSGTETPRAFLNDSTIVFDTRLMPGVEAATGSFQNQTYTVSTRGGRPKLLMSVPTLAMSVNSRGDILYRDRKGYEDPLRKHERSSGTGDIWLVRDGKFTRLTSFNGHDVDPVWGEGEQFYYVSEEDNNTLNIYTRNVDGTGRRRLTDYERHPVRSLSADAAGKILAYSWNGELYTLRPGEQPRKVEVNIATDLYDADNVKYFTGSGATALDVSPDGKEVAFVIRGDVYVTSTKYKTTRRITDTPGQERCISFSPDGKTLVYDSERDGKWQLFTAKIKGDKDKLFTYADEIVEEPLYSCATTAQQPEFSPDGKKVAFLEDRTAIRVIDLKTKETVTALDGKWNYSYADGDVGFRWSPDSRWLLASYIGEGGWNNSDIALVSADGSKVVDLTESGYAESNPRWALDGKGFTYESGRYGYKNQASWGEQTDILLMMLDGEGWDILNRTKEEAELAEENAKDDETAKDDSADKKKKDKKKKKKGDKDVDEADDAVKPLVFDLDNRRYRTRRLTSNSGFIGDYYLDRKGNNLYYTVSAPDGKANLMKKDLKKGETSMFASDVSGGFVPDKEGENLFIISGTGLSKLSLSDGSKEDIEFSALYTRTPSAEREYIFDHLLSQVEAKFYDENLHGVDWRGYGEDYRKFLPYISNNRDFATLMSEILGELNASHTGGRYYGSGPALSTASLGAFFDESYDGDGLKVAEVIARGPLSTRQANIGKGDIIMAIDGVEVKAGDDYYPLLDGKAGKKVKLDIKPADGSAVRRVEVKATSQGNLSDLLYERWVEHNQALVDSLSGGRLAYVHVEGMDSESYRRVYQDLLGRYRNREGVVVDTRFNGGGWLHNDLLILLSGKEYMQYVPRGRYVGSEPWAQWNKPSVMLVNEGNYSDASGTPEAYKALGIGDVVGSPVPGTMTAVWWETQIDPSLIFGIPQVTNKLYGKTVLENKQLDPDVLIYNNPGDLNRGKDAQLEAAVAHLLEQLK